MPPNIRFFFAAMTATLFFIAAIPLYGELTRRRDIWWTPPTMLVPLAESGDRVEIYVRGGPLAAHLERGRVRLVEDTRTSVLTPGEVGLRFNNWDRMRATKLPSLLIAAAACGAAALMFVLVVAGRLAYRGEHGRLAA